MADREHASGIDYGVGRYAYLSTGKPFVIRLAEFIASNDEAFVFAKSDEPFDNDTVLGFFFTPDDNSEKLLAFVSGWWLKVFPEGANRASVTLGNLGVIRRLPRGRMGGMRWEGKIQNGERTSKFESHVHGRLVQRRSFRGLRTGYYIIDLNRLFYLVDLLDAAE
tara:strand:+ start:510 stop:1004 length:495 start_codon:yes stop_codon:yes gene_type:complete